MQVNKPNRISRTYTQHLLAGPEAVFPLLCPVRESDWIDGWDPVSIISHSGIAEADCVFITEAQPVNAIWVITRHEPENGFVEMLKISPAVTVCKLNIQLTRTSTGCDAEITYCHTSLGPDGDRFIESFTESFYRKFMQEWEQRLNHYLTTGTILRMS